jgi:hypothetical protein
MRFRLGAVTVQAEANPAAAALRAQFAQARHELEEGAVEAETWSEIEFLLEELLEDSPRTAPLRRPV